MPHATNIIRIVTRFCLETNITNFTFIIRNKDLIHQFPCNRYCISIRSCKLERNLFITKQCRIFSFRKDMWTIFTFIRNLTTLPCSKNITWLVRHLEAKIFNRFILIVNKRLKHQFTSDVIRIPIVGMHHEGNFFTFLQFVILKFCKFMRSIRTFIRHLFTVPFTRNTTSFKRTYKRNTLTNVTLILIITNTNNKGHFFFLLRHPFKRNFFISQQLLKFACCKFMTCKHTRKCNAFAMILSHIRTIHRQIRRINFSRLHRHHIFIKKFQNLLTNRIQISFRMNIIKSINKNMTTFNRYKW